MRMDRTAIPSDHRLHAWVDGRLSPAEATELEACLDANPAERARWSDHREQSRELKRLLEARLEDAQYPQATGASTWRVNAVAWRVAAGLVLSVLSGAVGWGLNDLASPGPARPGEVVAARQDPFARSALVAHAVFSTDERRRVEMGADQEEQLVAWLSNRMAQPLRPPDLNALGYALEGGRLLTGSRGPMAQFMYRTTGTDRPAHRLTVAISNRIAGEATSTRASGSDPVPTAFRFAELDGVHAFYWVDGNMGYAISSGGDREPLAVVAQEVYRQLQRSGGER